ncbi:agmatine deiminase family protein [Paeniglutamicibacter sp. R2-26]|uniref:agmatine deiminase family protein n=1 Tax=Paeniglutamicibacter sp. R2-26 TaxID=3144417 RepID=UPI003EE5C2F8
MTNLIPTPADSGFSMPAEWAPHSACIMIWPARRELWQDRFDEAKRDYAAVARAIAAFEPVVMLCNPGLAAEVVAHCGAGVEPLEVQVDDSWARDSGPAFVTNDQGDVALVKFGFNAWGNRWHPHDQDALVPDRVAKHFGVPMFNAPFVLEGGAFLVDGEGSLLTTEQCLLNPNRNPGLSKEEIEQGLKDYLGVKTVTWLPYGHSLDVGPAGTDGHIDGVAQYAGPGHVLLEVPSDPASTEYERARANLAVLQGSTDAAGRELQVSILDPHPDTEVAYANHYLANDAVIVPVGGDGRDEEILEFLGGVYPDRTVVGVPGETIAFGGGGPHCITQQVPAAVAAR